MKALILLRLALASAWNRRYALGLTLLSITLAAALLLGVERLRAGAREGFSSALSGTDLVVGARGSHAHLLLYSVFRIGEPTPNLSWAAAQRIAAHPAVAWTVPISLGDAHRGFPVVGTQPDYFKRYQYGDAQALALTRGRLFDSLFEAVIGASVARELGYTLDQSIVLAHGSPELEGAEHRDKPFRVVGILAPTGTPVDRSVHISLASMEAIHVDWQGGMPLAGLSVPPELVRKFDLTPKTITAQLVGLKHRSDVFRLQRELNTAPGEALSAAMPGVVLDQLWQMLAAGERTLQAVSALVAAVSLAGLMAVILAGLDARRRELAILRSVGARPREVLALLIIEGLGITLAGCLLGLVLLQWAVWLGGAWLQSRFGIVVAGLWPGQDEWLRLAGIVATGLLASLLPAWRAYRLSLADGLSPRL
ncbi:ABC transporter permease [Uliginosibacterium aquaticum]|uniref:ABC transporter permease n=1 Tax=Uliginosibacterium aquaticum TaxID=2731212 RepID=A0ABX2IDL0_9RHOO|nr:ABC transporter permease [Uliginosibacterium aquaticum]NSL54157.1 ABC transporter permease [Uliginosibacterium aquaticum]